MTVATFNINNINKRLDNLLACRDAILSARLDIHLLFALTVLHV